MRCVIAASYSKKTLCPPLVRANAVLMFVGVTALNPLLIFLNGEKGGVYGGEKDILL